MLQQTCNRLPHKVVTIRSEKTIVCYVVLPDVWFDKHACCAKQAYMCMRVGLWEGMCYMQLSPGGLGYPGEIPMSQVLPCDMTHAKVLMCPMLSAMLHCLVLRDASLHDSKLSILLHTAQWDSGTSIQQGFASDVLVSIAVCM